MPSTSIPNKYSNTPGHVIPWLSAILILVFIYTAVSKLMSFEEFQGQMAKQPFGPLLRATVIWTLPPIEVITSVLLGIERTQRIGFINATILLSAFTIYIALILMGVFQKVPCTCGGVISEMGWRSHLIFNGCLLAVSCCGIYITGKERRLQNIQ